MQPTWDWAPTLRAHRRRGSVALLSLALLSACRDAAGPPSPGLLELAIVTIGDDIDADGFLLSFDGGPSRTVPVNGTWLWNGPGGTYSLAVTGLAMNCDMMSAPATVIITAGERTRAAVRVSCSLREVARRGTIRVSGTAAPR